MNTIARVMLVAVLALGSGCAKPDWIQQTLVTVDVTGAWSGDCIRGGAGGIPGGIIEMTLEQSGTKVTGQTRTSPSRSWGIDGTINGDVFRFSTQAGVSGELQVRGDEMGGQVSGSGLARCQLRRQTSSESPRSQ
jgi:hypothetical protein